MNLYLVTQRLNRGYDTYDGVVVAAETEQQARWVDPRCVVKSDFFDPTEVYKDYLDAPWESDWCHPNKVTVELLGLAKPGTTAGVILSSFKAG